MFQYLEHRTFAESKSSLCYDRTTRTSTDHDSNKGRKKQPHEFCSAGWWLKPRGEGRDGKDKTVIFSNCKRKGHEAISCFQRIGYPEWWGDRPHTTIGGRSGGHGRGVQHDTGGGRGRRGTTRANALQTSWIDGGRSVVTDFDRRGISGLSDEQWAILLTMLDSYKGVANEMLTSKQNILPWIIDTGASHHMIDTYECLNDLRDIMPCLVGLPNGAETKALKEGIVTLGEKLKP